MKNNLKFNYLTLQYKIKKFYSDVAAIYHYAALNINEICYLRYYNAKLNYGYEDSGHQYYRSNLQYKFNDDD